MRNIKLPQPLRIVLAGAVLLTASAARAGGLPVNAVVDLTPEGQNFVRPAPGAPVYYFPATIGFQEEGNWAPENLPATLDVQRMIAQALASQGYFVLAKDKPPTVVLSFRWGRMAPLADNDSNGSPETDMATLVGGIYQGSDLSALGPRLADFRTDASVPRYFLVIEAYDFAGAKVKNRIGLWSARFSVPAAGTTLEQALPEMIAAGVPLLGRDVRPHHVYAP